MSYKLSICIPSRNEELLDRTIQDVLEHTNPELTEIIAVLDGWIPNPPLTANDPRVTLIYHPKSKGQRKSVKEAVKLAKGKYICKLDAHCAVSSDFDIEMIKAMEELGEDVTLIPTMRNLHAWDFICPDGHDYRHYQGRSDEHGKCPTCGKKCIKDIVWISKPSPQSSCFRFDKTMHFAYWRDRVLTDEEKKSGFNETMSIQGSCYMLTKQKYLELDIDSDEFHSWGQNGVEVACKTWLSGGKVICNRKCYYSHMFRTQGGDFSFPYSNPQSKVDENRELSRQLFKGDKWPQATRSFQWLLDHFNPPDWSETKGIIYYTDNQLDDKIANLVRNQLLQISQEDHLPITSASLKKLEFGNKSIRFPSLQRSPQAMFKQILGALENSNADIIFFCEHDVLYHPSHFDFEPTDKNTFYFNNNVWKVDYQTGKALKVDKCEQLSGMCVYKDTAIQFVKEKIEQMNQEGFDRHYEPRGTRAGWMSKEPNVDIRHDNNLTPSRWSKDQFKNQDNTVGWTEGTCPQWAQEMLYSS